MSDEQFLIDFANMSKSAAITPPNSPNYGKSRNVIDEKDLIATADLSHSEKDRLLWKHDQHEYRRYDESQEDSDDEVDFGEEGVFDEDCYGNEGEIKPNAHTKGSLNSPSKPQFTEDRHRIQLSEDILISYAHLSNNQLRTTTQETTKNTFEAPAVVERIKVPKLNIRNIDNDDGHILDKGGLNSSKDHKDRHNYPERESIEGRKHQRIVINEGVSPGRSLAHDVDAADEDGEFNALLIDTANAMNASDFANVKTMLSDTDGLGPVLAGADSPITVINRLQRYKAVTPDNLHILQRVIAKLGNPLLHSRARNYVKQRAQTVFFHPDTADVLPGYETLKCRVSGKDFTRLTRNDLETLRCTVSRLLFMPVDSVYIVGVEPGINLVIALMVPQRYIGALMKLATEGRISELGTIGVDLLQISDRTFKTQGAAPMTSPGHEHLKFLTIYQQARHKNQQLEEKDREIADLKEEIEFIKLELETKNAELEMVAQRLKQVCSDWSDGRGRQPVRRRRSLPAMSRDFVTNTAIPVARHSVSMGNKSTKLKEGGRVNSRSTSKRDERRFKFETRTIVKSNETADDQAAEKTDKVRSGRKVFFAENIKKIAMNESDKYEQRGKGDDRRVDDDRQKSTMKTTSSDKPTVKPCDLPLMLDESFGARSRGFQWTRDDITALTNVRHAIERGELMDDIEGLLSELEVAGK